MYGQAVWVSAAAVAEALPEVWAACSSSAELSPAPSRAAAVVPAPESASSAETR